MWFLLIQSYIISTVTINLFKQSKHAYMVVKCMLLVRCIASALLYLKSTKELGNMYQTHPFLHTFLC